MNDDWLLTDDLAPAIEDEALAPLYQGANRHRLVLPFCPDCALPLELEQRMCDGCGAAGPEWREVQPEGRVHSVTVVHRLEPGLVRTQHPYPVADVELISGHRLVLAPATATATPPAIGDAVSIEFRRLDCVAIPAFQNEVSPAADWEESR